MEKYDVTLYEDYMVEYILEHIMSPNIELKTEVNIYRLPNLYKFFKSSTYLYIVVARL